jgi:hypothetical protein
MDELLVTANGKKMLLQIHAEYPLQQSPIERALSLAGAKIGIDRFLHYFVGNDQ